MEDWDNVSNRVKELKAEELLLRMAVNTNKSSSDETDRIELPIALYIS